MINLFLPAAPSRRMEDPGVFTTAGIYSPLSDFWYTAVGRPTSSRVRVTDDVALTYSAAWACTRIISSTLGGLPLNLMQRETDGAENVLRDDVRNHLVEFAPNEEMNAMMARAQGAIQQINGGNCFFEIERDEAGSIAAYWPIHRSRVKVKRGAAIFGDDGYIVDVDTDESGRDLYYEVKNNDSTVTIFDPREILHFPSMMSDDGISGKGVIAYARETIGFGLATERYGAKWFGTGGVPRVVVTQKGKMTEDARRNFRKEWKELYAGSDGDAVGLLTEGATITPINISNEDSQFLETRGHNIEEMARWYGVPVHMLQRVMQSGITGIEQVGIEFVTYTMIPWFRLWEQELHRKTLSREEQATHFYRFNVTELLRGDSKARAEYLRTMLQIGLKTPNEGRRMEGDNPYPDPAADKLYMQGAMMPIELVGTQPNLPKPDNAESQQGKDAQGNPGIGGAVALVEMQRGSEQRIVAAVGTALAEFAERLPKENVQRPAMLAAARIMLEDAADRVIRKEVWAARQAAKTPGTFLAWLDRFYGDEYPKLCEKVLSPVCSALVTLGVPANAENLAVLRAEGSRSELLALSGDCQVSELAGKVEVLTAYWEKVGAQSLANSVLSKQAA